jgi:hypothetical protein
MSLVTTRNRCARCLKVTGGIHTCTPTPEWRVIEQQRDDLLTICEELQESAEYWSEYFVPLGIVERLDSAIARVKGGAA